MSCYGTIKFKFIVFICTSISYHLSFIDLYYIIFSIITRFLYTDIISSEFNKFS